MSAISSRISAYFSHLVSQLGSDKDVHCVAVAHMVPNTLHFAPALDRMMTLSGLLAKPKSVTRPEYKILKDEYTMPGLTREWAADATQVVTTLYELGLSKKRVVLVDIGGYFVDSIDKITELFDGEILGVMEGTENGVQKYENRLPYKTPIITVARSPLKLPEDHLVASSVVFSIEAVLREQAEILQTRTAAVIGYGRVGRSIAGILRDRGINTVVYDMDAVKLAEAAARGFQAHTRLEDALPQASLVVCATGSRALGLRGFGMLQSGCVVASVTSSDDEFDLACLDAGYDRRELHQNMVRYDENRETGRHFFLIADGNAANFIHGAVIGPAIQLIEGEKLKAIRELIDRSVPVAKKSLHELNTDQRRTVAEVWIEHFL
ncbi:MULTISPECIES: NAD(P)-dependent oxidoreductase [Rhizobium]|uniref:NAD(P)-dependent oxidoreductase n=1 Tax=Rhizobium TaxID=379 RepID=UPI001C90DA16|nr:MULTISPECIES: NAD(P)-dependent oxidoreductase [Rhizobium]MBY2987008.1 adenosylhomocysteinase [Rhizobium leguminosarum]MBY3049142.1 adenosylhomocysteinase [Rhizobium laguerreae]WSH22692.1 NAD(P)-dependent oxidoreductase [Rhizobium ruizarguesonis]WSH35632.1 NAD(P)-dependent oxidoreductase [Rhizobium ruizarguesonis]